jgi:Uma2 family endonuclease
MSIATEPMVTPSEPQDDIPDVPIYRLTLAQYHAMARAGILTEDDPVEFIEGWLVRKMTKYRPHSRCTLRTRRALEDILPAGWYVDTQAPITTANSEPEPDVAVIRGDEADYPDGQPGAAEVPLVIEVADSTLRTDRGAKMRAYASASIPIYWIINLNERQVEVYTEPSGPAAEPEYQQRRNYGLGETVPVVLDGDEISHVAVRKLLP